MNLDWLYRSSGVLAAVCLIAIVLLILGQIIGRLYGFIIPSADDFAGYCMGASTFFALAYTLRSGGHIRVTMLVNHVPPIIARLLEIFCTGFASLLTGYFAWFMVKVAVESYRFGDVSQGHYPTPLWIPQSALAIGAIILCIAFIEDFIRVLLGYSPTYHDINETNTE